MANELQVKQKNIRDITGEQGVLYVSRKIIALMSKHIGRDNAISKRNVFKHFFGSPENYNQYQQAYLWQKLLAVMGYVRRKTKCFIVGEHKATDYYFFVAKTQTDANIYIKRAEDSINGLKGMQKRVQRAVDEKWFVKVEEAGSKYELSDKNQAKEIAME
jgi:hypothetical protein